MNHAGTFPNPSVSASVDAPARGDKAKGRARPARATSAKQRGSHPTLLAVYFLLLFGTASAFLASLDHMALPPLNGGPLAMILILAAALASTAFPIFVKAGRRMHSFTLHELPLVAAVLTLPARYAIMAVVIGATVARIGFQRMPLNKVLFNVFITTFDVGIVFRLTHGLAPRTSVTDTRIWVAALIGTVAANLVSAALVSVAIKLSGGHVTPSQFARNALWGIVGGLAMASVAIIGVVLTVVNSVSVIFTVLVGAACLLSYRRHVALSERYSAMIRLERFTRALAPDRSVETILDKLLHHAAELMSVEEAAITLATTEGLVVLSRSLSEKGEASGAKTLAPGDPIWIKALRENKAFHLDANELDTNDELRRELLELQATDLVVAPLRLDESNIGVLVGRNRLNSAVRVSASDLDLVTTMANHASVILERSRLMEELDREVNVREYQATHDTLTGLHNRAAFNAASDAYLCSDAAKDQIAAIMLVDLNQFKKINDTMGHHAGDDVLVQIGSRLAGALPIGSTVARLGGDEFAIMVPNVGSSERALEVASNLREAITLPVNVDDVTFALDAAIGVSFAPLHGTDRHTLLKRADIAMYAAKDRRTAAVAVYDASQQRWTAREVSLLEDLRHAIENHELWVAFQPKTSLKTGRVVGVEALCRWTHPEQGPIRPDEFVRLAEQAGLIDSLTEFVLTESLRQCRVWLDEGMEIAVAVNIASQSLGDPTLPGRILAHAENHGVPPKMLTLEVTEGELMEDARTSRAVMTELRALGFRVSIDDFGTGYSSLAYLHTLPVDELKIDRAFVQRIGTDATSAQIVHVIVELAQTFGLQTVAEGIETDEIHDALRALGVELGQGFLMSKPARASEIDEILRFGYRTSSDRQGEPALASA